MIKQGRQERRPLRLPGAVLAGPRRRGGGSPEGEGRHDDPPVGRQHGDRLLVVRDEGPEQRGLRVLPHAEAGATRRTSPSSCSSRARRRRCSAATARTTPRTVQGAGLVRLELRPGHQRLRVRQVRSSPVGRRTTRRPSSARSGLRTYLAVQVALNAIKRACDAGKGQIKDRRDVVRNVKKIVVKNSILGGDFRFSTKSNDPLNGEVLHLPDPVERLVQARRLARIATSPGAARPHGRAALASFVRV